MANLTSPRIEQDRSFRNRADREIVSFLQKESIHGSVLDLTGPGGAIDREEIFRPIRGPLPHFAIEKDLARFQHIKAAAKYNTSINPLLGDFFSKALASLDPEPVTYFFCTSETAGTLIDKGVINGFRKLLMTRKPSRIAFGLTCCNRNSQKNSTNQLLEYLAQQITPPWKLVSIKNLTWGAPNGGDQRSTHMQSAMMVLEKNSKRSSVSIPSPTTLYLKELPQMTPSGTSSPIPKPHSLLARKQSFVPTKSFSTSVEAINNLFTNGGIPEHFFGILNGAPGSGKTSLGLILAQTRGCEGLFYSAEMSEQLVLDTLGHLVWSENLQIFDQNLSAEECLQSANDFAKECHNRGTQPIIFIDSIQTIIPGNWGESHKRFCFTLKDIAHKTGAIVLLVGHNNSGGILAGGATWRQQVDAIIVVNRPDPGRRTVTYTTSKNRWGTEGKTTFHNF